MKFLRKSITDLRLDFKLRQNKVMEANRFKYILGCVHLIRNLGLFKLFEKSAKTIQWLNLGSVNLNLYARLLYQLSCPL